MRWPVGGEEASARGRTSQTTDLATQYIVDGNSWLSIIPMQGLKCQPRQTGPAMSTITIPKNDSGHKDAVSAERKTIVTPCNNTAIIGEQ